MQKQFCYMLYGDFLDFKGMITYHSYYGTPCNSNPQYHISSSNPHLTTSACSSFAPKYASMLHDRPDNLLKEAGESFLCQT